MALLTKKAKDASVVQPPNSISYKKSRWKAISKNWQLYLFVLPAFLYFLIFCYYPMYGVQIAFKDFNASKGIWGSPWTKTTLENGTVIYGIKHFINFFSSSQSWTIIKNTVITSMYLLLAGFPVPVILALMLNEVKSTKYKKLVQNVTYAPNFISTVVMVGMITMFFGNSGIINQFLRMLGFSGSNFLMDVGAFRHLYVWTGVWQSMGWSSIIYFAALSSVDPQLHEAATIDGATKFQRLVHINIPTILPTIIIMLIMQVGTIMNISFEKIYLMQNEINLSVSEVISTYVYKMGLRSAKFSYSAAIGLFNNVINLILLVAVNKVSAKLSDTSLW